MLRPTLSVALCFLGVLMGIVQTTRLAADESPKKAITDPEAELKAIVKEWREALQSKAKDKQPKFEPYGERCFQLVETFPQSPAAMRALVFVIAITRDTPQAARALDLIKPRVAEADLAYLSKHLIWWFPYGMAELAPLVFTKAKAKPEDPWAPTLVVWVGQAAAQGHSKDSGKLLHEAVEYLVRHHGGSSYLWSVLHSVDLAREPDTAWAEQQLRAMLATKSMDIVRRLAAYTLAALLAQQSEASQPEAEKWLRECLRICQEMKATGGNHKLDATEAMAQQLLAKIQRFGLGKAAPEIAGQDLDGQAFKLSDYRGKVVLLDFWGFWCGPCVRMIPHQRSLVERLEGKAFVLLGVNSDSDPAQVTSQLREHRVIWRSFKNKPGSEKNIAFDWMITSWPTLFLIDHRGIIRKTWDGIPDIKELDQEIDKIVSAAEKE